MVEQSVLANSSKFIDGPFEEELTEESDLTNSSTVVQDQWEDAIVGDFAFTKEPIVVEPIVVEQSVLADSSSFIEITEEKTEQEKDGSMLSEIEVEEEGELQEDIIFEKSLFV